MLPRYRGINKQNRYFLSEENSLHEPFYHIICLRYLKILEMKAIISPTQKSCESRATRTVISGEIPFLFPLFVPQYS